MKIYIAAFVLGVAVGAYAHNAHAVFVGPGMICGEVACCSTKPSGPCWPRSEPPVTQ